MSVNCWGGVLFLTWSQYFVTDHNDLQFGFKSGYSTMQCTGILKAFVNRYIKQSSDIYACLIDAFKAFDTVNHYVLFKKLLTRGVSIPIARFFLHWYCICSVFTGMVLTLLSFLVAMVSCQGSMLSPILFNVYVDSLLCAPCVNQVVVVTGTV